MRFSTLATLVALASANLAAVMACKCLKGGNFNVIDTRTCCERAGGSWDGRDCPDFSLPNPATVFNDCCAQHGSTSDC